MRVSEIDSSIRGQVILDEGSKNTQWRKESLQKRVLGNSIFIHKRRKLELLHTHKINTKWIKDLRVSLETIKVLEHSIGKKLLDFFYMKPKAHATTAKLGK